MIDGRSRLINGARRRAKDKGLPFNLIKEDIKIPDVCPVLGIPLKVNVGGKRQDANSPTIDRIDNTKGYTLDNIIVVSHRANTIKGDATLAELDTVAYFYRKLEVTRRANLDRP